ncbi:MAG: DUF4153 domain-containing protein [Gemmatimonadales bacterium]|jgi:hypothetical protein
MPLALPSLGAAVTGAQRALRRFPLVLAAAALAAAASVLAIEDVGPEWLHARLITTASLGIPLFLAAALLAERLRHRAVAQVALGLAGAVLVAGFFFGWPHWSDPVRFGRYVQLSVAFHLFVVFVPFARTGPRNAFWQYNRVLLERAILSAAFTGTLFLGLDLALVALDKLFGVDVPNTAYPRVWAVIAFVFNTWFFVGGVPEDPAALEERRDYPAVLRVFAQYALVPLVSVYLVILTLYLGKVVVTWDWPSGWIGNLVSGVAAAGIFALLLVHPIAEDAEQRWVATFARQFWIAVLPSIVMLWLALYQRVHQYGITERRYFLIVLSLWLAGLALYYGVTRAKGIRLIPVSLCVVALLTLAGPWGAYAVSEGSQVGRLRAALERNGMFADGTVRRPAREVSADDRAEISAVMRYLLETHGTGAIAPWFADTSARRVVLGAGERGRENADLIDRWADTVVTRLGVAYVSRAAARMGALYTNYQTGDAAELPVRGFDYLLPIRDSNKGEPDSVFVATWSRRPFAVRVVRGRDTLVVVPLDSMLARLRERDAGRSERMVPQRGPGGLAVLRPREVVEPRAELFTTEGESRSVRARVYVRLIAAKDSAGTRRIESLTGRVLLALKR